MANMFSDNIPLAITIVLSMFGIIAVHRLVSSRASKANFSELYPIPSNWPEHASI